MIFSTSQDDVDNILANPDILVGSDGLTINGRPHPRYMGPILKYLERLSVKGRSYRWKQLLIR